MMLAVNPGSGDVLGATETHALANIYEFLEDVLKAVHRMGKYEYVKVERMPHHDEGDGRFAFVLSIQGRSVRVRMPGLPLERVRYTSAPGQNIWTFPRLYINGRSYVWRFAVDHAVEVLTEAAS